MKTPPQPQAYDCPFLGHAISGVAARQCNYLNLDDCICRHTDELCVANEGLRAFAQSLSEASFSVDDFLRMKEKIERERRQRNYREIARMANHLFPPEDRI
jgi:hypothetical protein